MDSLFVQFSPARNGGVMCRVEGAVAFPDRRWPSRRPKDGEVWEVRVSGRGRRVLFLMPVEGPMETYQLQFADGAIFNGPNRLREVASQTVDGIRYSVHVHFGGRVRPRYYGITVARKDRYMACVGEGILDGHKAVFEGVGKDPEALVNEERAARAASRAAHERLRTLPESVVESVIAAVARGAGIGDPSDLREKSRMVMQGGFGIYLWPQWDSPSNALLVRFSPSGEILHQPDYDRWPPKPAPEPEPEPTDAEALWAYIVAHHPKLFGATVDVGGRQYGVSRNPTFPDDPAWAHPYEMIPMWGRDTESLFEQGVLLEWAEVLGYKEATHV